MPRKDREKKLEYYKDYYRKNKERHKVTARKWHLKTKYNLTEEDYNDLLIKQNFRCALCSKHFSETSRNLLIDHCHETGRVRVLLCTSCNMALGILGDTVSRMKKVLEYVTVNQGM